MVEKRSRIPLSVTHPDVASEWHPTNNGNVTPDQIVAGSGKKHWWTCPDGADHEWQTVVVSRTLNASGCPCCAGQQVSVTNSLATLSPEVASQWHPEKNGEITYATKKSLRQWLKWGFSDSGFRGAW